MVYSFWKARLGRITTVINFFLLFGKISRKCLNDQYLQFWHINCYLLCKNQQFSISNVRVVFLQTIIFYYFCWIWCRIFFSYFFHDERKKTFLELILWKFSKNFFNAKGSIVNLSNKSQKVLLNLLYLLWSYDYDVLIILTKLQFEN